MAQGQAMSFYLHKPRTESGRLDLLWTTAGNLRFRSFRDGEVLVAIEDRPRRAEWICTRCRISSFAKPDELWPKCPQCSQPMLRGNR